MRKSKLILAALGLSLLTLGQSDFGGYPKFNMRENIPYEHIKKIIIQEEKTYLYVWYDFDDNGKPDRLAIYPFSKENRFGLFEEPHTFCLIMGLEEKKAPAYGLEDTNRNGTLESFVKGKHLRKHIKEEIQKSNKKRKFEV